MGRDVHLGGRRGAHPGVSACWGLGHHGRRLGASLRHYNRNWGTRGDKMLFAFDGGNLSADQLSAIVFRDGEIGEWAFVDDTQLDRLTIPRLARRIRATMKARRS